MPFSNPYFYYLTIGLQAICVIHCIRKGNQNKWIWIIVFLPVVGCLAYLYTEMFTRRYLRNMQTGVGAVFNSGSNIKKLEQNLKFSDTFNNRVMLADAYLQAGQTDKAIELYNESLTGTFEENEYVLMQLITAYSQKEQWEEVVKKAKKIKHLPQFARSRQHLLYAKALHYVGNNKQAEVEFRMMTGRFANYEARYYYALFLMAIGSSEESHRLLAAIIDEQAHLSPLEKRNNRKWFGLVKEKLKGTAV